MVRIAITQAAYDAICATLPLESVGYENEANEKGERQIWLEPHVVAKLKYLRGPDETYSDVIIRLADHSERAKPESGARIALRAARSTLLTSLRRALYARFSGRA
jgi:hypothetical protein